MILKMSGMGYIYIYIKLYCVELSYLGAWPPFSINKLAPTILYSRIATLLITR
jgi:hypothetical protein